MAQMVFVHGVSVRDDKDYEPGVKARDKWFSDVVFKGKIKIANPYWGKHGAKPLTCIPAFSAKYDHLSTADDLGATEDLGLGAVAEKTFLEAAKKDFPAVVAALSIVALEDAAASGDAQTLQDAETLWRGAATYAEIQERPGWLEQIDTDDAFFERLNKEAAATAQTSLSVFDDMKKAGAKLVGGFSNLVNSPFGKVGRDVISPKVAIFIGDVFRYLKSGSIRDDIRKEVIDAIEPAARAAKDANEKLILAGHSMGGVILYDILSDPTAVSEISTRLGFPLKVDLFLTVGSQVAVFEEMRVFASSDPKRTGKANIPACVAAWWNVFDKMDVLSFLTEPVFNGVKDFNVDTIAGVKDAHGAYFHNAIFYERLRKRLETAKLV